MKILCVKQNCPKLEPKCLKNLKVVFVRTGLPVGVGIGSLPVTPNRNGEIGVLCVESDLAGVAEHNKT